MTAPKLTRTCQNEFTTAALLTALETAWAAIRTNHHEVPAAVIVVGSGSPTKASDSMKWGHFASLRWQHGSELLPEVLVSGEGLARPPEQVFTTLLHEAAHALADVRKIQDTTRQGRWHNKRFATLAGELGLDAEKDDKLGWSPCTLRPATTDRYRPVLADLASAISAYRHPERIAAAKTRRSNNNGVTAACGCPRKIRVAATVLEQGEIFCDVCETPFFTENQEGDRVPRYDFYDPTGERHGGLPTYPYKLAPDGLATVRQLRRYGLRPGGQRIAAQLLWRRGKRLAFLYRIDLAKPKRNATPAQREAIQRALLARRFCRSCQQTKPYYIPRRSGECLDCAPGGVR